MGSFGELLKGNLYHYSSH